jgi:uncharacterized protein
MSGSYAGGALGAVSAAAKSVAEATTVCSARMLKERDGRVFVEVQVVPRASRSAILGLHGDRLRVAVAAPPVEGAANEALVALFARELARPRRDVEIVRGQSGRKKTLAIRGVSVDQVTALLRAAGSRPARGSR